MHPQNSPGSLVCSRALAREQRVRNAVLAAKCERRRWGFLFSWTARSEWGENPHPFTTVLQRSSWEIETVFQLSPSKHFFFLSWQNTGKRTDSSLLKCKREKSRNKESEAGNTDVLSFIFNMQIFLHSCFSSHNITHSLAVASHAHIASKMGSPPFSSCCFPQLIQIFSLPATNNTLEGTSPERMSLCGWW